MLKSRLGEKERGLIRSWTVTCGSLDASRNKWFSIRQQTSDRLIPGNERRRACWMKLARIQGVNVTRQSRVDQSAVLIHGTDAMDNILPGGLQAKVKSLKEPGCDKRTYPRSLIVVISFHVLTD
jgi:hypothetical protein